MRKILTFENLNLDSDYINSERENNTSFKIKLNHFSKIRLLNTSWNH